MSAREALEQVSQGLFQTPGAEENSYVVRSRAQIERTGAACETLQSGERKLEIRFPCGTFEPFK